MMKLAVLVLFFGIAAASYMGDVSSQRAVIKHYTPHGYGNGVSARYFDKAVNYGYGLGYGLGGLGYGNLRGLSYGNRGGLSYGNRGGLSYGNSYMGGLGYGVYGGLAYDGIDNLGLAYTKRDLADGYGYGRLGYGYGGLAL